MPKFNIGDEVMADSSLGIDGVGVITEFSPSREYAVVDFGVEGYKYVHLSDLTTDFEEPEEDDYWDYGDEEECYDESRLQYLESLLEDGDVKVYDEKPNGDRKLLTKKNKLSDLTNIKTLINKKPAGDKIVVDAPEGTITISGKK